MFVDVISIISVQLTINTRAFKKVYEMELSLRVRITALSHVLLGLWLLQKMLLKELAPSEIADHKYHLEGTKERQLRREVCTPGTRVRILDDIITWAKNASADSPNVYWLFGPAGSGKSTIAYTIARRFEFAGDANDTIILGGNFFFS